MATADDDDLITGEALIRELANAADRVGQREAVGGVWDCHDRLSERGRYQDALLSRRERR